MECIINPQHACAELVIAVSCVCVYLHSRQLLKMLRRDTVVGGVAITSKNALPHPPFIVTYTMYTLMTLKTTTLLQLAIHTCSLLTITQLISTIANMYFTNLHDQASLLPKEIETLTCNAGALHLQIQNSC